jgi:hypothetical protein
MARVLALCGLILASTPLLAQRGPAPTMLHMDPQILALACAPSITYEQPTAPMRVRGGQDVMKRTSHSLGDLVTINAGSENGVEIGQEFYVRRVQVPGGSTVSQRNPGVVKTAGWIKVWAVDPTMSLATVTHACDSINIGDHLEPFALPTPPAVSTESLKPEKDNYGKVMLGADRRRIFAKGDFFVLDRGSNQGVARGARFVIFRDKLQFQNFLFDLGEAVAVDVRDDSATLQVTLSRDAMMVGDYVAMRK